MLLYDELTDWYRLIDPAADHADEAAAYEAALERAATPRPETLLELGAGAGNNAFHLKRRFRCTLADLAPEMSALSRELNPECDHVLGDMRTLRLGRTFDAVLLHDAVMYMTSEADLRAAIETAFVHLRPGGAAVFAPDCVRETLRDQAVLLESDDGGRSMRGIEWTWDPDPDDDTYTVEYAFLLRDGQDVRSVHDRHVEGVFPRATWVRLLEDAGFRVDTFPRPLDDDTYDEVFVAVRPSWR
jgi:SAM-dependent methyltransferase